MRMSSGWSLLPAGAKPNGDFVAYPPNLDETADEGGIGLAAAVLTQDGEEGTFRLITVLYFAAMPNPLCARAVN